MDPTSETETSQGQDTTVLVQKAIKGDVDAYGELYRIYLDRIYRYVFYLVGNTMMAEDITEEVFIKAWKAIKSCRGREKTFSPWLYRIAHNHMVDTLKKTPKNASSEFNDSAESKDVAQQVEVTLECQQVIKMISDLPELQKQVIILKFLDGADNDEIEQITGKRQGAIRALQMRALITLRERLNGEVNGNGA